MPKQPNAKFMTLGKSKFVHVVRTAAYDRKNSECQQVRKYMVAEKIDYKAKGLSAEAALALTGCPDCGTEVVAKAMIPADVKRAEAREKRDEVLERAKGSKAKKAKVVKAKPGKDKKAESGDPAPRKAVSKTKSGMRSVGSDTDSKAKALAAFTADNGWSTDILHDDVTGHTVVRASLADMTINAYFIDGKYDVARHATLSVGSWSGLLRGAHAVRRQVDKDLNDRDRPHPAPGKGRSGPRKKASVEDDVPEDESPEDAQRRVPFSMDDPDIEVMDALLGKTIRWRNGISNSVEEATLPAEARPKRKRAKRDVVKVTTHPKTGKRMVEFLTVMGVNEDGEVYGPERVVALEKIVRVVG